MIPQIAVLIIKQHTQSIIVPDGAIFFGDFGNQIFHIRLISNNAYIEIFGIISDLDRSLHRRRSAVGVVENIGLRNFFPFRRRLIGRNGSIADLDHIGSVFKFDFADFPERTDFAGGSQEITDIGHIRRNFHGKDRSLPLIGGGGLKFQGFQTGAAALFAGKILKSYAAGFNFADGAVFNGNTQSTGRGKFFGSDLAVVAVITVNFAAFAFFHRQTGN